MKHEEELLFPITYSNDRVYSYGLTKRELFAAMAMQGMLSDALTTQEEKAVIAKWAVGNADALLKELAESDEEPSSRPKGDENE